MAGNDFSAFGERFARSTGIRTLMADLGAGIAGEAPLLMLGGGNPARIPAMHALFREQMRRIVEDDAAFGRMFEDYSPPHGDTELVRPDAAFAATLAEASKEKYGYAPPPEMYEESGVHVFRPKTVFAWKDFAKDATRWRL